jgi:hypothetical protein
MPVLIIAGRIQQYIAYDLPPILHTDIPKGLELAVKE